MGVREGDHHEEHRGRAPSGRPDAERPALSLTTSERLSVPVRWPEVAAYRAGRRLSEADLDLVPMLMRQGLPIDIYLEPVELAGMLELSASTWERWFHFGWMVATNDEEGE